MTLKEYFKNCLLKNLHESKSERKERTPRTLLDIQKEDKPPLNPVSIDPIDPLEAEEGGVDDTVANLIQSGRKKLMGHDYAAYRAARAARIADRLYAQYQRPVYPRKGSTRLVRDVESSSVPTEEEIQKTLRTRNLLDTIHHFSREHDIELKPEHIEGIDFSNPDIKSHIAEITRRLM